MSNQQIQPGDGASSSLTRSASAGVRSPASGALTLIRQASNRRFLREPSARVRLAAGEQVEERQTDLAYSWAVVALDLIWNAGFIAASLIVVGFSVDERPSAPLRLWIFGYAAQCCVHMVCVWSEYQRRQELRESSSRRANSSGSRTLSGSRSRQGAPGDESPREPLAESLLRPQDVQVGRRDDTVASAEGDEEDARGGLQRGGTAEDEERTDDDDADDFGMWDRSLARQVESVNTMFSFVWWVFGLGWLLSTFDDTFQDAPFLSWLCMIFLAFDVFFVIFCAALACVIGIAVCCCLPCIIAVLYAVGGKDGASSEAIEALPRFKFRKSATQKASLPQVMTSSGEEVSLTVDEPQGGYIVAVDAAEGVVGRPVSAEDAECCICLNSYSDGTQLRELPCGHHFDQSCLDKWLRTKPTCPLCKYDIMKKCRPGASPPGTSMVSPEQTGAEEPDTEAPSTPGGVEAPPTLLGAIQSSAGFFQNPSRNT